MKEIRLKKNHLTRENHNYIKQYLNFLGIEDDMIPSFLGEPKSTDYEDPRGLCNIEKAAKAYYFAANSGDNIFVQIDADADGFTSSSILIGYTKRRFPNAKIHWRLQNGKEHGVILDTIPEDTNLVVIPDAGSNQFEEHKALAERGIKTIVLDHHELVGGLDISDTPAIIVNNQLSENFQNKSLSGAGVVLKFIQFLDETFFDYELPIWTNYLDLAAIGIIGDAMNMRNLDNNYISVYGLNNIRNKFIHSLAIKQERGVKDPDHLTKGDVAWYIVPVINGVIRSGSPEDKEAVFMAMINNEGDADLYKHEWRGVVKMENLYERAVRLAVNAKSRQDSNKKKSFEWLCDKVRAEGLDKNNIIIVTLNDKESDKVGANITGLIAMELVKEFNKPCLVLRKTEFEGQNVFGGSGRNGHFLNLPDLKAALTEANAYYCAGHANAFGAFILPDQVKNITAFFNEHYNAEEFSDEILEVDYWFHTGERIDSGMLMDFAKAAHLYGNAIPEPKFAFDANIKKTDYMAMGKDKSSLKIRYDGIDFVAFKAETIINKLNELTKNGSTHIQIVGKANLNSWNGTESVQIMIDDIEIENIEQGETAVNVEDLI